jgi:hypothetical protein
MFAKDYAKTKARAATDNVFADLGLQVFTVMNKSILKAVQVPLGSFYTSSSL